MLRPDLDPNQLLFSHSFLCAELLCDAEVAFVGLHGIVLTHSGLDRLSPSSKTFSGPCTGTGAYYS